MPVAARTLPTGYGYEYSGMTREEAQMAGSHDTVIIYCICVLFIYLILCALYESLFVPMAVIMSVPFGLAGSFLFARMWGLENNIYLQTGLIMLIGLLSKPAFIGYLPYGFPNPDISLDALRTMIEHGVDAVEIGLPYSDPVMDGPVIQAASQIALNNGESINGVFKAVETVANAGGVPLIMSYWNLIYHYGVERFACDFENAGGAGLITPDLIPAPTFAPCSGVDTPIPTHTFLAPALRARSTSVSGDALMVSRSPVTPIRDAA